MNHSEQLRCVRVVSMVLISGELKTKAITINKDNTKANILSILLRIR